MSDRVEVLKALANKNRLDIFQYLREPEGEQGVTGLAKHFELSPSTVSEHLKELRRAGLIKVKKTGPWLKCWVNQEMLKELSSYFAPDLLANEEGCE